MEGKGNGLIILLHGGPGTGKTLTAESVAELTEKPLYRIACGDIGTNAEDVEKYLISVFYIGTIWKCVVLLDEADVFLEERQTDQLQRNALVSVFLRALEYYDGILVLTSNRVGTFDEAFKSRVQISLHYPRLNKRSGTKIWFSFIDSLSGEDAELEQLRKRVDLLAKKNLNGREIRNTVKSAMQLARFKKEKLQYSHLERVIDISTGFTTYLKEVHGHSEAEWAESKGIRGKD
jgi:SpoVK/Ycf46/Vps4 family AAA+-type ATPase